MLALIVVIGSSLEELAGFLVVVGTGSIVGLFVVVPMVRGRSATGVGEEAVTSLLVLGSLRVAIVESLSRLAVVCWEVEERSSWGLVFDWSQFGLSLRKILLWLATCFVVFEPTSSASLMLEEGPSLARASRNSRCSPSVHKVLWTESESAAWAARCSLAAAACWFRTCCARDFLFGKQAPQNSHLREPASSFLRVGSGVFRGSSCDGWRRIFGTGILDRRYCR